MPVSRETIQKLNALFNGNKTLIVDYIQKYGDNLKLEYINEFRLKIKILPEIKFSDSQKGENPLYNIELECPVCKYENLPFFELRAKSQFRYFDQFMVPLYLGISGFRTVNYTHLAVCICPQCFFASPDKKDFTSYSLASREKVESKIPPIILKGLEISSGERKSMANDLGSPMPLFQFPRNSEYTILSYRLCLLRVEEEIQNQLPYARYKKGAYWLRIALIQRLAQTDDSNALTEAALAFEASFAHSDFPNAELEFQTIYCIFAIYLRLDQIDQGRKYLSVFDQSLAEFEKGIRGEPGGATAVKVWKGKALALWEAREDEDLWAIPKPKR